MNLPVRNDLTFTVKEKSLSTSSFSKTSGVTQSGKVKLCWDYICTRQEEHTDTASGLFVNLITINLIVGVLTLGIIDYAMLQCQ